MPTLTLSEQDRKFLKSLRISDELAIEYDYEPRRTVTPAEATAIFRDMQKKWRREERLRRELLSWIPAALLVLAIVIIEVCR